jgi:hypothetical protein
MSFQQYMARVIQVLQTQLESAREVSVIAGAPFEAPVFRAPAATPEEINAGLQLAGPAIESLEDALQAGRLAMLCGMFVEAGGEARLVSRAIARLASRCLVQMEAMLDALDPKGDSPFDVLAQYAAWPDAVKAWVSMSELIVLPTMATLTRDADARRTARQDAALVRGAARFEDIIPNMYYLSALLDCVEALPVVVLEPERRRGWRLEISGVRTCFHMFTLMKGVLPWAGTPDEALLAYARGEVMEHEADYDETPWDLMDASAWDGERWRTDWMDRMILGEQRPDEVWTYEGQAVVLIRPVTVQRTWSAGFFAPLHEMHRAQARCVAALEEAEVTAWLERLRALATAT